MIRKGLINKLIQWQAAALFVFIFSDLSAQNLFISRFVPGNYLANELHRVEIFNATLQARDLSGYLLVTRNYSVRFPQGSVAQPFSGFSLSKRSMRDNKVDLELSTTPDFLIRFPDPARKGNYILLFDQRMNKVDGLYYCPSAKVDFLPDVGLMITFSGDSITFGIPDEKDKFWERRKLSLSEDPAVAYIQVTGNWVPTGIRTNLLPAVSFGIPEGSWYEGIVHLKFSTGFEDNCYYHFVERSLNGLDFEVAGKVKARGISARTIEYEFYDPSTRKGVMYFYRIRNRDIYGNDIVSPLTEIVTDYKPEEFTMELFPGSGGFGDEVNLRFRSRINQNVNIRLYRNDFREEGLVFKGYVNGDEQNLVKFRRNLDPARYLVVAETNSKRIFAEFEVK